MVTEIRGALKVLGTLDAEDFTDVKDLLKAIAANMAVEIPDNITNVVVSNIQPTSGQRDSIWFRRSNSGVFLGIFVFTGNIWKQLTPAPGEIFWAFNQSGTVPDGYSKVDATRGDIQASVITKIVAEYVKDPTNTFDVYFAMTYEGL